MNVPPGPFTHWILLPPSDHLLKPLPSKRGSRLLTTPDSGAGAASTPDTRRLALRSENWTIVDNVWNPGVVRLEQRTRDGTRYRLWEFRSLIFIASTSSQSFPKPSSAMPEDPLRTMRWDQQRLAISAVESCRNVSTSAPVATNAAGPFPESRCM